MLVRYEILRRAILKNSMFSSVCGYRAHNMNSTLGYDGIAMDVQESVPVSFVVLCNAQSPANHADRSE